MRNVHYISPINLFSFTRTEKRGGNRIENYEVYSTQIKWKLMLIIVWNGTFAHIYWYKDKCYTLRDGQLFDTNNFNYSSKNSWLVGLFGCWFGFICFFFSFLLLLNLPTEHRHTNQEAKHTQNWNNENTENKINYIVEWKKCLPNYLNEIFKISRSQQSACITKAWHWIYCTYDTYR